MMVCVQDVKNIIRCGSVSGSRPNRKDVFIRPRPFILIL